MFASIWPIWKTRPNRILGSLQLNYNYRLLPGRHSVKFTKIMMRIKDISVERRLA